MKKRVFFFGTIIFFILTGTIIVCLKSLNMQSIRSKISFEDAIGTHLITSQQFAREYLKGKTNKVIFYIEGEGCSSCIQELVYQVYCNIKDSISDFVPLMIYHPYVSVDSISRNNFVNDFSDFSNVVTSETDSIRLGNDWLLPRIGLYGIVLDSINNIEYVGILFDSKFQESAIFINRQSNL